MLLVLVAAWSQVWRLRSLLKRPALRPRVGMGPDIKTDFSQLFKNFKRSLKSPFVSSDCCRAVSFDPTCTITRFMEDGSDGISADSSPRMIETGAPGKQCAAFTKRRFLICWQQMGPMYLVLGGSPTGWVSSSNPWKVFVSHNSFGTGVERCTFLVDGPSGY